MSMDPTGTVGLGPVLVVGTGLLGTSIGLGLSSMGVPVLLDDVSPTALAVARDMGAGTPVGEGPVGDAEDVGLVVVCAPPDVTGAVVVEQLRRHPGAYVTDVSSVKLAVVGAVRAAGEGLGDRFAGGHPMAGRERSGPTAARADLFIGRPWVVCGEGVAADRVRALARSLGATPVLMDPQAHDDAVAVVSHVPQVVASLVAARLLKAADPAVGLAGAGLRDMTRIADSDALLWAQILAANAGPVGSVLADLRSDLDGVIAALDALAEPGAAVGARSVLARTVAAGRAGRERIPGKHGEPPTAYARLTVLLPDEPGQLGRLFEDIGSAGINIEEFSLEHSPGRPFGLGEVSVLPAVRDELEQSLAALGWRVVG
jgi:prephenate dehydrogenase